MSKFVKRGPLGVYLEVSGGQSDPDCSHVILTLREYNQLLEDIAQAKRDKISAVNEFNTKIDKINAQANKTLQNAERDISSLEDQLAAESRTAALQREINQNLIRICRERANAERNLRPKKQHTGYVVLDSRMKTYRYKVRSRWEEVVLWEARLQTPYSVQLPAENVKELVESDMKIEGDEVRLLQNLGIHYLYQGDYEEMLRHRCEKFSEDKNTMFPWRYSANYRAGYWEISFLHTKPLGPAPAEMRPGN